MTRRAPENAYNCQLQLRWSDQLLHDHIDHVRVLTLIEEARIRAGRVWSGTTPDGGSGENRVVRSLYTEYERELNYRDDGDGTAMIEARVWISRIGTTSYTVCHELVQDGRVGVYAEAVIVMLSKADGTPTPIPERIRRELLQFQHPDEWYH
ncbi:acyl-CoA thioesterase [Citricoccus sp. NR2]|uniref:acyl-CoA thioesterase n=1 Tax=Citricoccus sp. NR2 TaxID=3004095 RepID=UPI0022DD8CE5|nr:acyl-CoA thioesterase [Citricoccus sp. NR2]WBL20032.1 acyl-CoA thioesterase [Citricoccus sp. NR2]